MSEFDNQLVLIADDDDSVLDLIRHYLINANLRVVTARDGQDALTKVKRYQPDMIICDVMMPVMNGYELCAEIHRLPVGHHIPIVFVTALNQEQDKIKAIQCGAVDYLVKPFSKDDLITTIRVQLKTKQLWRELQQADQHRSRQPSHSEFQGFCAFLARHYEHNDALLKILPDVKPEQLYAGAEQVAIPSSEVAESMAEFLKLSYVPYIDPHTVTLGTLPKLFCQKNNIIELESATDERLFVMSNPFIWEIRDLLDRIIGKRYHYRMLITEPENIRTFFAVAGHTHDDQHRKNKVIFINNDGQTMDVDAEIHPIQHLGDMLLRRAITARASDIHIEPKESTVLIRFRIDGDLHDVFSIKNETGDRLVSRFKAITGMNIAEKRRPQD
ncbi:MAG: response regulator, partial [Elusimicrobia bacterium]|nr:response regulator [Elusimicrobiota bacterium]MBD3412385.1 response regulator [Elusimicrobiota bacterium]